MAGDFAVGGFGITSERSPYHLVGHNHIAAHRQAVHEVGVASECHLLGGDGPVHILADDFSVVGSREATPVFGINKVGTTQSLVLVVRDFCAAGELFVEVRSLQGMQSRNRSRWHLSIRQTSWAQPVGEPWGEEPM